MPGAGFPLVALTHDDTAFSILTLYLDSHIVPLAAEHINNRAGIFIKVFVGIIILNRLHLSLCPASHKDSIFAGAYHLMGLGITDLDNVIFSDSIGHKVAGHFIYSPVTHAILTN